MKHLRNNVNFMNKAIQKTCHIYSDAKISIKPGLLKILWKLN